MQAHFAVTKSQLIIPEKKKLLRKSLRGNERDHAREREHNKYLGKRGFQIKFFSWSGEQIARFCAEEESDIIELFIQIHTPGAFPYREYNIDPNEVGNVQLFITQSLTAGAGTTQNFVTPATWGHNTTSIIGGGGNGGNGAFGGAPTTGSGGTGGGGGAFVSIDASLDRNANTPYFIGSITQDSWFKSSSYALAQGGNSGNSAGTGGQGGQASTSIGTIKRSGGNGGNCITGNGGVCSGGGGGGAGSPNIAGTNGGNGTLTPVGTSQTGGNGGASSVAGGAGGTTAPGVGSAGNAGTDFDASHGAGSGAGGGGANSGSSTSAAGGSAGLYGGGAGGGGAVGSNISSGGAGRQGMIFLSWSPYIYTEVYNTN